MPAADLSDAEIAALKLPTRKITDQTLGRRRPRRLDRTQFQTLVPANAERLRHRN